MTIATTETVTVYEDGDATYVITRDRQGEISLKYRYGDNRIIFSDLKTLELVVKTLQKVSRSWH